MKLKSIQQTYIQKSRIFLYPLLGIRRGVSVTPIQTFMAWQGVYTVSDHKFIAQYHLRDDQEFKTFEEKMLIGNPLFHDMFELEDGTGVYVFDMSENKAAYKRIVHGKYSKLDDDHKKKILSFFKHHHTHHAYIESYLYPKKYFDNYASLLKVPVSLIKEVGELCSLPDLTAEKLQLMKKVVTFESVNHL